MVTYPKLPVENNNQALIGLRKVFEQNIGRRRLLIENCANAESSLKKNLLDYENCIKARTVVQTVAKSTQEKIEICISNLVSMALATVFPDPYAFTLRFVERRNTTEADLIFSKNDNETDDLLNTGGGGVADIASFALRIALWSLKKTRATFILDEPDKFLHNPEYQTKASELMHELCEKMDIQIILVSDQERIIAAADKVIRVSNKNGISEVDNEI
jgi:DNA repair exonuclease SbcCD ATPase subunit